MASAVLNEWVSLTKDGSVRVLKYGFGPGTANTLATRRDDGSWLVVSPGSRAPDSVFEALSKDGPVSALVAPNGYHHLGQPSWRSRFPDAVSYAPEGALGRLAKQSAGVPYRPLSELQRALPSSVQVVVPDGFKSPDVLVRIVNGDDTVWWLGDLFSNDTKADLNLLLRMILPLVGGGLGYRRNSRPGLLYVKDEKAWLASVRAHVGASLPSIAVPAHGDPVTEGTASRTRPLLQD